MTRTTYSVWAPASGMLPRGERATFTAYDSDPAEWASAWQDARIRAVELAESYAVECYRHGAANMAAASPIVVYASHRAEPAYSVRTVQCSECGRPMLSDADHAGAPVLFRIASDADGRPLCAPCELARDPAGAIALMPDEAVPA